MTKQMEEMISGSPRVSFLVPGAENVQEQNISQKDQNAVYTLHCNT